MRLSSSWRTRRARLAVSLEMPSSSPARSGLTSSAAAVGVGARRSATKSAIVKSVSWPMPVTTGIGHARIARATLSSLKAHKSSMLPPPRTSNMTSHPPSRPAILSAQAIFSDAPSPWTCTGKTTTSIDGLRRASVVNTSRRAAASREVITPIARGKEGRARFVSALNRPSFSSLSRSLRNASNRAPSPARRMVSTLSWKSPRGSYKLTSACTSICMPSRGVHSRFCWRCRNMTQRTWACSSLRTK